VFKFSSFSSPQAYSEEDWGQGGVVGSGDMDLAWAVVSLSSVHTAQAGEEGGGGRVHGVPRTLLFWGCKEGWPSIFSCNLCNIDDSRGLRHAGDLTIQVPAGSSPSSSLMKFGSSCCSACFSFPEANFIRLMKSCKKDFDMIELN